MKKYIRSDKHTHTSIQHSIYDENMEWAINNYLVPELSKMYDDVKLTASGICIIDNGFKFYVKIVELLYKIANFEWSLYINDDLVLSVQSSNSDEYFVNRTLNAIKNYVDNHQNDDNTSENITSAENTDNQINDGTIYYKTTVEEIIDTLKDQEANPWLIAAFQNDGYDAIDFKHNLYGSAVLDDGLYICVTDGHDIEVNGEEVDPEDALEDYSVDELSKYIQPATPDIIKRWITPDEIKKPWLDKWAPELLNSGHSFIELAEAAKEFFDFD